MNEEITNEEAKPVIEETKQENIQEEVVEVKRNESSLNEKIDENNKENSIVKSEEGEKTLDDYIREEFSKDDSNIEDLNVQKFFSDIEGKITEEDKKSEIYQKLQHVKEKFLRVVNFNFVHKYRYKDFSIPVKYRTRKEKEDFIRSYPELAIKKLEKNKNYFVSPNAAWSHFRKVFTKEELEAARNFYYVFCHYIVHRDVNTNAYAIMYVLNRMLRFDENYAKEEFAFREDLKATTSEELNCHAIKQLILENYSGKIVKWKKEKISRHF